MKLNEIREKERCQKSEDRVLTDLLSAFHVFDVQNKGYIESRDLREALGLTVTDIPSKELQEMLKEIGLLNDRKITFAGDALRVTVDSYPIMILDSTRALGWGGGGLGGVGNSHMKRSRVVVVSLSGINQGFLASLKVLIKKRRYFQLSKYLLGCTRRNNNNRNAIVSNFRLHFRQSFESGLLAKAPDLVL